MVNNILEIKDLTTEFISNNQSVKAINRVNFSIKEGEIVGVVGESGSGKSVTSLSAMGLIPTPEGKVTHGEILFTKSDGTTVDTTNRNVNTSTLQVIHIDRRCQSYTQTKQMYIQFK